LHSEPRMKQPDSQRPFKRRGWVAAKGVTQKKHVLASRDLRSWGDDWAC